MLQSAGLMSSPSNAKLLKKYSRHGLHEALKPHLTDEAQFETVDAYSMLSTKAAVILGSRLRGMTQPGIVETVAGLDEAACKFAVELVDAYAAAVHDHAGGAEDELDATADNELVAGQALGQLLKNGTTLLKNAMSERKSAIAVMQRMSGAVGDDVWNVLSHSGSIRHLSQCSGPVAVGFGSLAPQINGNIAGALAGVNDDKAAVYFIQQLVKLCGPDQVLRWIETDELIAVWSSIVMDINQECWRDDQTADLTDTQKMTLRGLCRAMQERCSPQPISSQAVEEQPAPTPKVEPPSQPETPATPEWSDTVAAARNKSLVQ